MSQPSLLDVFAVTAPGLETLCAAELAKLGVRGTVVEGGVAWSGSMETVARANLWLRTASRVIVRVAEFKAKAFFELELKAKKIEWQRWLTPNSRVAFRVTCKKSKLYHSGAVAQRFADAVTSRVKGATVVDDPADEDAPAHRAAQLFIVRFSRDVCTVSVDTSGALLHLRGYRQQLAKAPLRETLAAAVLHGSGWKADVPLVDPMCGSGTIPIEAALIARRMAPGRDRAFAFQQWPKFDQKMWKTLVGDARAGELPASPVPIAGADRDAGAITAATANAERAGVASDVQFFVQPISALAPMPAPGIVVSNPPYGVRVGDADALKNLYAQFGNVLRRQRAGWTVALLSGNRALESQVKLAFEEKFQTRNGGIPVRLLTATVEG